MPRNRELDDAAELLRRLHHHASWLCNKVNMRRCVKLMKKMRKERKLKKLRMLHIKYKFKQIKKQMKQLKKEIDFKSYCLHEQAFENLLYDLSRKSALTAPACHEANTKIATIRSDRRIGGPLDPSPIPWS
jgi:hypothetical protein